MKSLGLLSPKNIKEALQLDKENGNTLWADAISTEMKNIKVAFKILDDVEISPRDHQFFKCHMIFDINMDNFRRKASLVEGSHMTTAPAAVTYASVVSRETIHIALPLATLNDLEVKCGDVLNAYITALLRIRYGITWDLSMVKMKARRTLLLGPFMALNPVDLLSVLIFVNVWLI